MTHCMQANGVRPGESISLCNETAKWIIDETAKNGEDSGRLLFHTSHPPCFAFALQQLLPQTDYYCSWAFD